jgi:hypothetical protein
MVIDYGTFFWPETGSNGTVTGVSVASANGFAGTVATASTTPVITISTTVTGILYGNGTSVAAAVAANFPTLPYISTTLGATATSGGLTVSGNTLSAAQSSGLQNGWLSSTDWTTFNNKQASGNYITALTGDVTASGAGSVAATLATVNSNTGSFGSTTSIPSFTVNGKGLITAASSNVVVAPAGTLSGTVLNSTVVTSSLTSVGTIATGVWNGTTIAIANGGTGQTSANAAFNALSPMTTGGDLIYGGTSGAATRLANGSAGQFLKSQGTTLAPVWAAPSVSFTAPTVTKITSTGSTTGYLFTISTSSTLAVGDTYTNNGNTYVVQGALNAQTGQVLFMSNASAPLASGTLTKVVSASGPATIAFSANVPTATYTPPASLLYLKINGTGGGGGGAGGGTAAGTGAGTGGTTFFGPNIITAVGGVGGIWENTGSGGGGGTTTIAAGPLVLGPLIGGDGANGTYTAALDYEVAGCGGVNIFGGNGQGGGGGGSTAATAGKANTGAGGGGGGSTTTGSAGQGGGAGGPFQVIITSPAASYPYIVGVGGTNGGAGTGGAAGAAGGTGLISIEEHYQ